METTTLLTVLVAALAFNELIHLMFEVWGARQKVAWLKARMDQKPHGDWPIRIDSLAKTLLLHGALFCLCVGVAFAGLVWLNFHPHILLGLACVLLVVTYSFTTLGMDAFHQEIGALLKRYKRQ
jgi:hypothetical protein